jgi:hypothetical protein
MGIKITYKKKAPLSNEPQTTLKFASKEKGGTKESSKQPAKGPVPFIDKISVVMDVPAEDGQKLYGHIFTQFKDTIAFKSGKLVKPYTTARRIVLPSVVHDKKWPLLQCRMSFQDKTTFALRIEFSPIDLGIKGMDELHSVLVSLVDGGWSYFVTHGRVTMIEVTVDLPGINMEQFSVLPKQGTVSRAWGSNGKLETTVLGKAAGNQTKIYDRGKKRKAKGQGWSGPITTRVERKLRPQPKLQLADLASLKNPFADITLLPSAIGPPPDEPDTKEYLWTLFQDSIQIRGLVAALKLLPEVKRTTYRKWLAQHPAEWWKPHVIWSHWPKYISDIQISDPHEWK